MKFGQRWMRQPQRVWLRRALFQVHLWTGIGLGPYVVILSHTIPGRTFLQAALARTSDALARLRFKEFDADLSLVEEFTQATPTAESGPF